MYNNNRIKNIELPENLFSNLGKVKPKNVERNIPIVEEKSDFAENYEKENDIKLTNFSRHAEYRDRIAKMYEDLKNIRPIDNEIENIAYFNNYVEKGIVIKPKVSSLKQFWTEFRLINNEKNNLPETSVVKTETDDFEALFDALSIRINEINKYIEDLREMKNSINNTKTQLKEDKERLKMEKKEFQSYKQTEENKIKEDKENLKINFERLQTIIDDLDKKLGSIYN